MNSVFGVLIHFQMRLHQDKIGKEKFFVFTAGSIFWPISRVMGVINEFDLRCFASFTNALTVG